MDDRTGSRHKAFFTAFAYPDGNGWSAGVIEAPTVRAWAERQSDIGAEIRRALAGWMGSDGFDLTITIGTARHRRDDRAHGMADASA